MVGCRGAADRHRADAERRSGRARVLGARSIALISITAALRLRNMPSVAEYDWSSIAYYGLGALSFFLPLALVAAELGTDWPRAGGCTHG